MLQLSKTKPELACFMSQFQACTSPHPTSPHLRIWEDRALFEISIFDNAIRLSYIGTLSIGKGDGTAALQWITKLADTHNITLKGTLQRMNKEGLNTRQLRFWYKKYGFTIEKNTIVYHGKSSTSP